MILRDHIWDVMTVLDANHQAKFMKQIHASRLPAAGKSIIESKIGQELQREIQLNSKKLQKE